MSCCSKPLAARGGAVSPQTTMDPPTTPLSFYRRPLPESCTALSSEEGQARFASALANNGLKSFFPLIEQFTTQSEPAFCGISTLVIVLNALAMDPKRSWKGPWRWYEESMLNCGLNLEEVKTTGITISEFQCLAICQGLEVSVTRVDQEEDEEIGLQKFRQAVERACVKTTQSTNNDNSQKKDELLVVSYSRQVLGQTGTGHFSPVAAYDAASDSVLVLDTARFKYGAHWVSLPLLFQAMKPIDPDTGRSRGYILLSDHDQNREEDRIPLMPSLLFRSQRKQNPIRRDYKDFLATIDTSITFDQVAAFWTKNNPKYIWKMMEPQFRPVEGDQSGQLIDSVLELMQTILPKVKQIPLPKECCPCRVNRGRTLDLTPEEAIFVVFLASLESDARKEIVMLGGVGDSGEMTPAQQQLLTEAELVRHAIDMSDAAVDGAECN